MRKGILAVLMAALVFVFVLLVSAAPILIREAAGQIRLNWKGAFQVIGGYFHGFATGDSLHYKVGRAMHDYMHDVWSYFFLSLTYVTVSGILAVIFGILLGMWFTRTKREWAKELLDFFSTLPDFVLIILLQLLIVMLYQSTGVSLFKIASATTDNPAIVLPIFSMMLVPGLYLMRNVSIHTFHVLTEEYVLNAKAKGLGRLYIYMHHVLPNVLPFLKADSHKLLGIMMGNLFIVEYLFNLRGMTRLMFTMLIHRDYQYDVLANTFFLLVVLYIVVYLIIRLFIRGLERKFSL